MPPTKQKAPYQPNNKLKYNLKAPPFRFNVPFKMWATGPSSAGKTLYSTQLLGNPSLYKPTHWIKRFAQSPTKIAPNSNSAIPVFDASVFNFLPHNKFDKFDKIYVVYPGTSLQLQYGRLARMAIDGKVRLVSLEDEEATKEFLQDLNEKVDNIEPWLIYADDFQSFGRVGQAGEVLKKIGSHFSGDTHHLNTSIFVNGQDDALSKTGTGSGAGGNENILSVRKNADAIWDTGTDSRWTQQLTGDKPYLISQHKQHYPAPFTIVDLKQLTQLTPGSDRTELLNSFVYAPRFDQYADNIEDYAKVIDDESFSPLELVKRIARRPNRAPRNKKKVEIAVPSEASEWETDND